MTGLFDFPPDWKKHWKGMPAFNQADQTPYQSVIVHFRNPEDRKAFADLIERNLTDRTRSVWYPREEIRRCMNKCFVSEKFQNPRHPVYVISKGRWKSRLTGKALEKMGVPYKMVVEPQEHDRYASVMDEKNMLDLPFSNLGKGSIPARNWVWEHSLETGASYHWILDDNLNGFFRLVDNLKTPVGCGNIFRAAEDFVERYENVALAGFHYFMMRARKMVWPSYQLNSRVYSCILIRNDLEHRWRGIYNEDTDLSLRVLKDGWCTVLFNAFLCLKMTTMIMKGGNTDELYKDDGRRKMAESLKKQHPDVVEISRKWGRWQHHVDYKKFGRNKLKLKKDAVVEKGVDNYGMYLKFLEPRDVRTLLIGQAPSQNSDPSTPLEGKIGGRLAKLAGVSVEDYLRSTERMNLFDEWTGKDGKGDAWNAKLARKKAEELLPLLRERRTIFVGRNVATAFGLAEMPWLTWTPIFEGSVAVIPHPSGIVLWWNDKQNRLAASEFLTDALKPLVDSADEKTKVVDD